MYGREANDWEKSAWRMRQGGFRIGEKLKMQDARIAPSLGEAYRKYFLIGAAVNGYILRDEQHRELCPAT